MIRCGYGLFTNSVIFKIIPHAFVRIQFGRIWGQEEQTKTFFDSFRFNKLHNALGFMRRVSIDNQENHPLRTMKKTFDKFNKFRSSHSPFDGHKTKFSLGIDSGNNIQTETRTCRTDNRCFAFDGPCCTGMMIRAYASFISKVYLGLKAACHAFDSGIFFLKPLLNDFRFLLVCTPDRLLRCKTQLCQQAADRCLAQFNAKSLMDDFADHFRCPKGKCKLQLQRVLHGDGLVNPSHGAYSDASRHSIPIHSAT